MTDPAVEYPLNERAAYQEAVCTASLEGKAAGIKAYEDFIERYPTSGLVHGAVLRIRKLNDDEPTPRCEALWKRAKKIQAEVEREFSLKQAQCGPKCLSAALAHFGIEVAAEQLAREARTGVRGTTLADMARVARQHGLSAVGLKLTPEALREQPLPSIALVGPHYVVVEAADPSGVTFRDDERSERVDWPEWERRWSGILLRLSRRGAELLAANERE